MREYFTIQFRHPLALLLLLPAWRFLSQWYLYLQPIDYLLFALCFLASVLLASFPFLKRHFRTVTRNRLIFVFAILVFGLPWCEWGRTSSDSARQGWSKQIFFNFLFIYGVAIALKVFPPLSKTVVEKSDRLLKKTAAKKAVLWAPAVAFFLLTSWIAIAFYNKIPIIQDAASHIFQAKVFTQGQLYAPAPAPESSFRVLGDMLVIHESRWFTMYPPGFALILALAMMISAEWLLCPFLGALTVAIWIAYARRFHNSETAVLLGILCLLSPFLLLLSSTIMVHVPELFITSSVIYLCRSEIEGRPHWLRPAALFLLLVLGVLVRPFSILPFLFPILFYTAWKKMHNREWFSIAAIIAGCGLGVALLSYFQWKTTGNPYLTGYVLEYPGLGYGFGPSSLGIVHTPLRGLENVSGNILGINSYFMGTYSGALFFFVIAILLMRKFDKYDYLFLISSILLLGQYFFTIWAGLELGPRFVYVLTPIILLQIARGFVDWNPKLQPARTVAFSLLIVSCFTSIPDGFQILAPYGLLQNQNTYLIEQIQKNREKKTVVFIDKRCRQTLIDWNDPFLITPVILTVDRGNEWNQKVTELYPEHQPVYFRLSINLSKGSLEGGYRFYREPDGRQQGYISLFEVGMLVESLKETPDKDFFSVIYDNSLMPDSANIHLAYLETLQNGTEPQKYQDQFRLSLIEMLRLPLMFWRAYEQKQHHWPEVMDFEAFRKSLEHAIRLSKACGPIGIQIHFELQKLFKRLDHNHDSYAAKEEILHFLEERLEPVQMHHAYVSHLQTNTER